MPKGNHPGVHMKKKSKHHHHHKTEQKRLSQENPRADTDGFQEDVAAVDVVEPVENPPIITQEAKRASKDSKNEDMEEIKKVVGRTSASSQASEVNEVIGLMSTNNGTPDVIELNATTLKEWRPKFVKHYGYLSLFKYATCSDIFLMLIGSVAAILAGVCIPAIIYFFGELLRSKVLLDKMTCSTNETSENATLCTQFLEVCKTKGSFTNKELKNLASDPSQYPNFRLQFTAQKMLEFVSVELSITSAYAVLSSVYFLCWNYASQNQGAKMRRAYYLSLIHKDITWFDKQKNPEAINRMMENSRRIVEAMGESIPIALNLSVMCTLCMLVAFWHGWQLSLMAISTLPLTFFSRWLVTSLKASRILKMRRAYRMPHDLAQEVFSKMRTVICYSMQVKERAIYKRELDGGDRKVYWKILQTSAAIFLMYFISSGLCGCVVYYGMVLGTSKESLMHCSDKHTFSIYDAVDVVVIILSVLFGCGNVYLIYSVCKAAQVAKLCVKEVFKVIDDESGIDALDEEGLSPTQDLKGKIEFIDVRFTYPSTRKLILNHLSFEAEPNSLVAVVGLSDSGKSTVLKLICKEYLADSGFIKLDGYDIRALNTKWLRSVIGYIPQECVLFDMSIEDNVRMGKLDASFYEIQDACRIAGAHDFIISLKEGYQTRIGHKGSILTPGEKQCIAVARALIRNPKILLIDEPTFALDSQSAMHFMGSMRKICKNRTVILVAHRLATTVNASMIYVLKTGRIVERGDHQTLVKAKGPYSELCRQNRPSKSVHNDVKLEGFDTSELTIISLAKTFNPRLMLPNLYNNMLCVDPVISRVTRGIITQGGNTDNGFHAQLEWALVDGEPLQEEPIRENDTGNIFGANAIAMKKDKFVRPAGNKIPDDIYETFGGEDPSETLRLSKAALERQNKSATSERTRKRSVTSMEDVADDYGGVSMFNCPRHAGLRLVAISSSNLLFVILGTIATIFFSLGTPLFGLLFPVMIEIFSDLNFYPKNWFAVTWFGKNLNYPNALGIAVGLWGVYMGVCGFLQDFCLSVAGHHTVQRLRLLLYTRIISQDMSFFDDPDNYGIRLASILFQDTDAIRHFTTGVYGITVQCIVVLVGAVALCMYQVIDLSAYTLAILGAVVGINLVDGWLAKRQHHRIIRGLQEISDLILQIFQSKHVISVCQMEPHYINEFSIVQRHTMRSVKALSCFRTVTYGLAQSASFWGFGMFLDLGARRLQDDEQKQVRFLDITTPCFILIFGLITLGSNLSVVMSFKYVTKAGKRMLEILDRAPLPMFVGNTPAVKEGFQESIELVNINLVRPQNPAYGVLKGINLEISAMSLTAIVGCPESGMIGFLDLLGRYYTASSGILSMGGFDVLEYDHAILRQFISVVTQEPELFNRTVAQNIAAGSNSGRATMEEIIEAAKKVNVHNLILSLPEGYETRVSGNHDYLSTAQKHKICMARAMLKDPQLLIINDITEGLDGEGEKAVLASIEMIRRDRTIVFISHRLQPVKMADWIVVVEQGYVEEQGTHEELLKKKATVSVYEQMWRFQNPMDDDNFIKGTLHYLPPPVHNSSEVIEKPSVIEEAQKKPKRHKSKMDRKPSLKEAPPPPPPEPEPEDTEEEKADGGCGFFRSLGMGIVDWSKEENRFGRSRFGRFLPDK